MYESLILDDPSIIAELEKKLAKSEKKLQIQNNLKEINQQFKI